MIELGNWGLGLLLGYGTVMILTALVTSRGRRQDASEFLLASRQVTVGPGAMSVAASWIWAPALFLAAQKAYDDGVAGLFWFVVPNVLALVLFAPLATAVRNRHPHGFTLPQFMRKEHGRGVHILYLVQFLGLQICSFAVQILAASALIASFSNLPESVVAILLVLMALSYSFVGGIRASILTDFLQMALIFAVIAITIPWALSKTGGIQSVLGGLGGAAGGTNLFDPWVAYSFGIPVTIGLLSGPIGDQQHWQRAFSLGKASDIRKTFFRGAVLFAIVPLSLSLLGFLAANESVSAGWVPITDSQLIAVIAIQEIGANGGALSFAILICFTVMLLSGLSSTMDSVLCAGASIAVVDLPAAFDSKANAMDEHSTRTVRNARIAMITIALVGLAIASIPGLQILHLFLFYGTLRASTMIPTIVTSLGWHVKSPAIFWAILLSLIFGAPVYAAGSYLKNPHLSVAGSLLVVTIGFVVVVLGRRRGQSHE